jgi:hypothetical protein
MKRRTALLIALVSSLILVSLASSDSTVMAQQGGMQRIADTGVLSLGQNQILRVTALYGDFTNDSPIRIRFGRMEYMQAACNSDGVCKQTVSSQVISNPITLMPGEAASLELVATTYGRGIVFSNSRNVRVTAAIINTVTGETTSHIIMANTEGDF